MDVQNNTVHIQITAQDLQGRRLHPTDCEVFQVRVFTDNPTQFLTFSKRDMLMTESVVELTIPRHQMEQLNSGVVQYTYHYLPVAHDCIYEEEDRVEAEGQYHPHRHPHRHEELINSNPVVTPVYWRNLTHHHHDRPLNSVTLFDIERLHRLIDQERSTREKDVETLTAQFGEGFSSRLDAEIERSTVQDELHNSAILDLQKAVADLEKETGDNKDNTDKEIVTNATDIVNETARATQAEIKLKQDIEAEVARAKAAEEVLSTSVQMERERATANEANINDRLVSLTDRFDAHKELSTETLKSEIERAKATEAALNEKVQGVAGDLAAEVSRAAQKDIEHTNLVTTEANRAQAVENKISTDLETEVNRAKDAEKHILDEVHGVQDVVANLATATNVYTKAEVDTKVNAVSNDIASLQNWIQNHTDNTDELKTKVAALVADMDKAKADILAEVAKCDAENDKLATELKTLSDSIYTKAEVDATISTLDGAIATLNNWIANHSDNTDELKAKVTKVVADVEQLSIDLTKEVADRSNADTVLATQIEVAAGKVDAEVTRATAKEDALAGQIADLAAQVANKSAANSEAVEAVAADLVVEVARGKAAEKVLTDAVAIINGDNATSGSIAKAEADAKAYADAEIAKHNLAKDVEIADKLKSYPTNAEVDKKISDVIGTAPEALDTLGKISNVLAQDGDAIAAINGVLAGKADASAVYTKGETDTLLTGLENTHATDKTTLENAISLVESRVDVQNSNLAALTVHVDEADAALTDSISAEIERAKIAEKNLASKEDLDFLNLDSKIGAVNSDLIAEVAHRSAKDTETDANIQALNTLVANVDTKVDAEVARATAKDNELVARDTAIEAKADANAQAIATETARAKQVETELNAKINGITIDATNTAISDEADRAKAAESALQSAINSEVVRAKAAEEATATGLADEVTRAKAAEKAISDKVDAIDMTPVTTALSDEVNRAKSAESGLFDAITTTQTNLDSLYNTIDAEADRAKAAEKANADAIVAIQVDVTALNASLTQAKADSTAKDTELETAIGNEKTRAEGVEKVLSDALAIINGDASTVGSIAHAVHDAEHYTDDEIAKIQVVVDNFKSEVANDYATKERVNSLLDGYATKSLVVDCINDIGALQRDKADWSGVYTKAEVDEAIANVDVTEQLKDYISKADAVEVINAAVEESEKIVEIKAEVADVSTALAAEAERAQAAEEEIYASINKIADSLEAAIDDLNGLFGDGDEEGEGWSVVTTTELDKALESYVKTDDAVQVIASTVADATDGIMTQVYTKEEVDAMLSQVYADMGGYLKAVTMTQEEYDALEEYDDNKLYVIVG